MSRTATALKPVEEAESEEQKIDEIACETLVVPIVGTTPVITNRFSAKKKRQMLDGMQGKKSPKQPKNPRAEFLDAAYRLDSDRYGVPAVAFKCAAVGGARFYPKTVITMKALRQYLFFIGEVGEDGIQLVPLIRPDDAPEEWPRMREDVVRLRGGGTDLRYRPEFWPWSATLRVTYVTTSLSRGSTLSLIDAGGLGVGVGEWRPEKNGDFGTYRIDASKEVEVIQGLEDRQ